MTTTSYKIASDLFLVRAPTPTAAQTRVVKPKPTNHVVVVDVSGSMSSELPKLRSQLKDKLVHLLRDDDTISIIWFRHRRAGRASCCARRAQGGPTARRVRHEPAWRPASRTRRRQPLLVLRAARQGRVPAGRDVRAALLARRRHIMCFGSTESANIASHATTTDTPSE